MALKKMLAAVASGSVFSSVMPADPATVSPENWQWVLQPTIVAEDIIVIDKKAEGSYRHYATEECAYILQDGKYGVIQYDGTLLIQPEYDSYTPWMWAMPPHPT